MHLKKNIPINGRHGRPILMDVFCGSDLGPAPVIIFCHGYKGYKDWGAWNLMAESFADEGICLVKFNFSFNGGTIDQPIDFPDLEAFAQNNYSKELDDLQTVIDWVCTELDQIYTIDLSNITLIGHSRGGGIVTIIAEKDHRIKRVVSLAGVSDFKNRFNEGSDEFKMWQTTGVKYVLNGRTKQQMPHYFQFYEDFKSNEDRLTIERAVRHLKIPHLIIHGDHDTSVLIDEANQLHQWNPNSELNIIKNANHVFNTSHPWRSSSLSPELQRVVDVSVAFISSTDT